MDNDRKQKNWSRAVPKSVVSSSALRFKKGRSSASSLFPPTQPALRSLLSSHRSLCRSRSAPTHHHIDKICSDAHDPKRPQTAINSKSTIPIGLGQVATKYADAWGIHLLPLFTKPSPEDDATEALAEEQQSDDKEDEQDAQRKVKDLIRKEAAYVAASHRPDRPLPRRIESAQRAADLHEQRTGRRLKVTAQYVEEGMVYPEM